MEEAKKHEWYGLAPTQRERLVLELLTQGYTADMLNEYFDVKTKRVINDFMNARGYRKRGNSYVPKQQSENMSAAPIMHQQNNMLPNIQIDDETIFNIMSLSKQYDKIQEIIDSYDNGTLSTNNGPTESYIEVVDTSMPILKIEGEIKRTTIRVNENIMSDFNKLWKDKYSEYKQHDLLNLALQNFIDKYK